VNSCAEIRGSGSPPPRPTGPATPSPTSDQPFSPLGPEGAPWTADPSPATRTPFSSPSPPRTSRRSARAPSGTPHASPPPWSSAAACTTHHLPDHRRLPGDTRHPAHRPRYVGKDEHLLAIVGTAAAHYCSPANGRAYVRPGQSQLRNSRAAELRRTRAILRK
jgi:hypothetical protein